MIFCSKVMNLNIKNAVPYLTFKELEKISFVKHAFSTRLGGVSKNNFRSLNLGFKTSDSMDNVYENYKLFCEATGFDKESMAFINQVHGNNIKIVTNENLLQMGDFDGSITNVPGITLVTFHADCTPIYLVDPQTKSIGLLHAGWRGTVKNIAKSAIDSMKINFQSKPEDILCFIGPSIHKCCLEIKEDLLEYFKNIGKNIIYKRENKIYADVIECNIIYLLRCGIKRENIVVSDLCTKCNSDLFFSHRAQPNGGRMASLIKIK